MTVALSTAEGRGGVMVLDVVGAASTDNGGLGALANPLGADLLITKAFWHVITSSAAAANFSAGIGTLAAASTDIVNALACGAGTEPGKIWQGPADAGAKTEVVPAVWTSAKFLNLKGSASTVGLIGKLYLYFIRLDTD